MKIKEFKETKAITLVSLVVTIIILLILAGVSLNLVVGEEGIVKRTSDARDENEIAQEKEKIQLALSSFSISANENSDYDTSFNNIISETFPNDVDIINDKSNIILKIKSSNRTYVIDNNKNVLKVDWWREQENDNFYITNEKKKYQIGDFVEYNPSSNGEQTYTAYSTETRCQFRTKI